MTAQFSDTFVFLEEGWNLSGIKGNGLFSPQQYKLTPVSWCTGCWRGYLASYEIVESRLFLKSLEICLTTPPRLGELAKKVLAPEINGIKPLKIEHENALFEYEYEDLNLLIPFSGGLILAKDFINELYVHMGFHPPWKYRRVYELIFDNGGLLESRDISEDMKIIRETLSKKPLEPNSENIQEVGKWVRKCFSLDYDDIKYDMISKQKSSREVIEFNWKPSLFEKMLNFLTGIWS